MKNLTIATLAFSLVLPISTAVALPVKTVFTNNLQGMVIKVWAGHDLSVDFINSGEVVTNAVIGNPSIVLGGLGGTLCPRISTSEQECNNTGAPAIYLRQTKIDPQSSYLVPSTDGKTSLILTTSGPEGTKNYVLTILPARGSPEYAGVVVQSPMQQPDVILPPELPRQNLPVVRDPEPTWQAQTPTPVRQSNNDVKLPSVNSTQQETPIPTQNPSASIPKTVPTPVAAPMADVAPSLDIDRSSRTAPAPTQESTANNSLAPVSREQKAAIPNPRFSAENSNTEVSRTATPVNNNNTTSLPTVSNKPTAQEFNHSITQANAIVRGLAVARQKGQINVGTTTWNQVQSVVRLMRRGNTEQESAKAVGVSLQLIDQLIVWGQRPTVATASN